MADLTAKLVASVILIKDAKCLVLDEVDDDGVRRLNTPGGHVEMGETLVSGAIREVKEETGFDLKFGDIVGMRIVTWKKGNQSVRFFCTGEIIGGELGTAGGEPGTTARWMTVDEIEQTKDSDWTLACRHFVLLAMREGYKIDSKAVLMFDRGEQRIV